MTETQIETAPKQYILKPVKWKKAGPGDTRFLSNFDDCQVEQIGDTYETLNNERQHKTLAAAQKAAEREFHAETKQRLSPA